MLLQHRVIYPQPMKGTLQDKEHEETPRRNPNKARTGNSARSKGTPQRSYLASAVLALIGVGLAVAFSAVINPLFGRYIHWDWMAVVGPVLFLALAVALRRRWV